MERHRVRIRFRKEGDLRLISHRDLVRTWERLLRRAGLQLGMSLGFHPKPRMNFLSALGLGIAGRNEVLELELAETPIVDDIRARLEPCLPPGLAIESIEVLAAEQKKTRVRNLVFELPVPPGQAAVVQERIDRLMASDAHWVARGDGSPPVDIRPGLAALAIRDDTLHMSLSFSQEGGTRPRAVLEELGLGDYEQQGLILTRTVVELET
jgi:radical SAM-linked protein